MAWRIYDEAVELVNLRYRYFPRIFRWRGQRFEVEAVGHCWTVNRRGRRGRVQRHFFQVRCAEGDFELYQEIRTGTWHLRRACLADGRVSLARVVAAAWQ